MESLDPQVRIKLIEISREWTEKTRKFDDWEDARKQRIDDFDDIY